MRNKTLVVLSNRLIEARYRLSIEEQKLIRVLASMVERDDKDFNQYEFSIIDLARSIGITHNQPYRVLKNITARLMTRLLQYDDIESEKLIQASWLSSSVYSYGEGRVILSFDPALKPFFLLLDSHFTKYELGNIIRFNSTYAVRFYEMTKENLGIGRKNVKIPVDLLRKQLGITDKEYKKFADFRRKILEVAEREINAHSDVNFGWAATRRGRGGKVVEIEFIFSNKAKSTDDEIVSTVKTKKKPVNKQIVISTNSETNSIQIESAIVAILIENGLSPASLAKKFAENYPEEYLREKIAYTIAQADQNRVNGSVGGFLRSAIENDFKPHNVQDQVQEERKQEREAEKKQAETLKSSLNAAYNEYRAGCINNLVDSLTEDSERLLRDKLLAEIAPKINIGLKTTLEQQHENGKIWYHERFLRFVVPFLVAHQALVVKTKAEWIADQN